MGVGFTCAQISRTGDWGYIGVGYGVMLDWVGSLNIIRTPWRHQPDVWNTKCPCTCWCHATQLSSHYLLQKSSISGKAEIAESQVICLITPGLQKCSLLYCEVKEQPDGCSCMLVIQTESDISSGAIQGPGRGRSVATFQPAPGAASSCPASAPPSESSILGRFSQFRNYVFYKATQS